MSRATALFWGWQMGALGTFAALMWQDWPTLNWWNWLIILPVNGFLAEIWPLYWLVIRPLFE